MLTTTTTRVYIARSIRFALGGIKMQRGSIVYTASGYGEERRSGAKSFSLKFWPQMRLDIDLRRAYGGAGCVSLKRTMCMERSMRVSSR